MTCVACGSPIDVARREPVCDGCMPTPGIYRHMKGGLYTVLGLATDEATLNGDLDEFMAQAPVAGRGNSNRSK